MVSKEAYMQKMQAKAEELDAHIKLWQAQARLAKADARINAENQLEALGQQREEITQQLADLANTGEEKLQDLKEQAETTWHTVTETVNEKTPNVEIPTERHTARKLSIGVTGILILLFMVRWVQENI